MRLLTLLFVFMAPMLAAATGGTLLFSQTQLHRALVTPAVETTLIPSLPTAECLVLRIQGEAIRTYELMMLGNGSIRVGAGEDIQAGLFQGDVDRGLILRVPIPAVQTPYVGPGTLFTIVFITPFEGEVTLTDADTVEALRGANGSSVDWVAVGTVNGVTCQGGNCAVRLSDFHTFRVTAEVYR